MALQFTQDRCEEHLALEGIFHEETSIRKICCNWLLISYQFGRTQTDFFSVAQKNNSEYWFQVLTKICEIDDKMNSKLITSQCL